MEKLFHLVAGAGLIILGWLKLFMPDILSMETTVWIWLLLLWINSIGDLVVDAHNVIEYHR